MTIFATKKLNQWCGFFLPIFAVVFLFSSCGKISHSASSETAIHLAIPEGESPDLFWYGVQNKMIRVEKEGEDPKDLSWQENTRIPFELNEGDGLRFAGVDRNGRVLVEGEVKVGKEKNITILLHRVL